MAHLVMTLQAEGGIIAIEVCDRGPGIAPEDVERLLRPFSRGEAARTGVSAAGLGLAIWSGCSSMWVDPAHAPREGAVLNRADRAAQSQI